MASRRESVMDNLVSTIAAIATSGGYNFSVGECKLGLKHFNAVPEDKFPAAYVSGADEERHNVTNREFRSDLMVSIVAYVKTTDAADTEQLERDVSKLAEDLTKALYVDVTRGGYCTFTEVQAIKTDKGSWTPFAGFELVVRCEYRATFAAP